MYAHDTKVLLYLLHVSGKDAKKINSCFIPCILNTQMKDVSPVPLQWKIQYIAFMLCRQACISIHEKARTVCECFYQNDLVLSMGKYQGSKYQITGSYQMGVFHIGYRILGGISGIRAHIGRSYWTVYIMKY